METIASLASIVRSKNCSPFDITYELFFDDGERYSRAKDSGQITASLVGELYSVDVKNVAIYFCDEVNAIKITMPRLHPVGSRWDTDVMGAQQHAPLLHIQVS